MKKSLHASEQASQQTWQSIRSELQRRISTRDWAPGDIIPTEVELAQEFGCARATVNRAMRALADTGQVERRRKAGTRVVETPTRKASFDIPITRLEVERIGAEWSHRVIEKKLLRPPLQIANRLMLPNRAQALHIKSLHFADHKPFVYEDRWVNPSAVPAIKKADLNEVSVNEWLVQQAPFTRGEFTLSASSATASEAALLSVDKGAPLLIIDRMTFNDDRAVTCVRLAYPPGYRVQSIL
ncbi:MAG: GntR family transcriptional regulator [Burkholderiaceae bacterium]